MAVVTQNSVTESLGRVLSTSTRAVVRKLQDAAFGSRATWNTIYKNMRREDLGTSNDLQVPLLLAKPGKADSFRDDDTTSTAFVDVVTAMTFTVQDYIYNATYTWRDMMKANGNTGFDDLVKREVGIGMDDLTDRLNADCSADGTGNGTTRLVGSAAFADDGNTTGNYGNVSRASNSNHRNVSTDNSNTTGDVLEDIRTSYTSASSGGDEPDYIFSGRTARNVYESKLMTTNYWESTTIAGGPGNARHKALQYGSANWIVDEDFGNWGGGTNVNVLMVNSKYLNLRVRAGVDFLVQETRYTASGQQVFVVPILFSGILYADQLRSHAVIFNMAAA